MNRSDHNNNTTRSPRSSTFATSTASTPASSRNGTDRSRVTGPRSVQQSNDVTNLRKENRTLKDEVEKLKVRLGTEECKVSNLNTILGDVQKDRDEQRVELRIIREQIKDKDRHIAALNRDKDELLASNMQMAHQSEPDRINQDQVPVLQQELADLKVQLKSKDLTLKELNKKLDQLSSKFEEQKRELNKTRQREYYAKKGVEIERNKTIASNHSNQQNMNLMEEQRRKFKEANITNKEIISALANNFLNDVNASFEQNKQALEAAESETAAKKAKVDASTKEVQFIISSSRKRTSAQAYYQKCHICHQQFHCEDQWKKHCKDPRSSCFKHIPGPSSD